MRAVATGAASLAFGEAQKPAEGKEKRRHKRQNDDENLHNIEISVYFIHEKWR